MENSLDTNMLSPEAKIFNCEHCKREFYSDEARINHVTIGDCQKKEERKHIKVTFDIDPHDYVATANNIYQSMQNVFAALGENPEIKDVEALFNAYQRGFQEITKWRLQKSILPSKTLKIDLSEYRKNGEKHLSEKQLKDKKHDDKKLIISEKKQTKKKQAFDLLAGLGIDASALLAGLCLIHKKQKAECGCK